MFDIWKSFCYIEVSIVQKSRAYGYDTTPIRH